MNGQETAAPNAVVLAILGIAAAAGVIAVLLLGGSWTPWVFYSLITAGILVATGSVGALVKVVRDDG